MPLTLTRLNITNGELRMTNTANTLSAAAVTIGSGGKLTIASASVPAAAISVLPGGTLTTSNSVTGSFTAMAGTWIISAGTSFSNVFACQFGGSVQVVYGQCVRITRLFHTGLTRGLMCCDIVSAVEVRLVRVRPRSALVVRLIWCPDQQR